MPNSLIFCASGPELSKRGENKLYGNVATRLDWISVIWAEKAREGDPRAGTYDYSLPFALWIPRPQSSSSRVFRSSIYSTLQIKNIDHVRVSCSIALELMQQILLSPLTFLNSFQVITAMWRFQQANASSPRSAPATTISTYVQSLLCYDHKFDLFTHIIIIEKFPALVPGL